MGCGSSRAADDLAESVSPNSDALSGQVAIVTGPTNGIGYETARILAKHGAHVFLAARSTARAEKCMEIFIQQIKAELPHSEPRFTVLPLDLSSLASVKNAADQFLSTGLPLNLLINNAGIMTLDSTYSSTKDGYESHVGTNSLGHYYFTQLLLPKLRSTAASVGVAKVIALTSGLHNPSIKSPDDIENTFINAQQNYSDFECYNRSKLYNIYQAQTLAANEAGNHILAFAVHPGVIATNWNHSATGVKKCLTNFGSLFSISPNAGTATTIHCVFREKASNSGKYFANCAVAKPRAKATDEKLRAKLIEVLEKLVAQFEASSTAPIPPAADLSAV